MEERLRRLREKIGHLDGVIISDSFNRRYLSGFTGSAGFLFITAEKAIIAVDFRYVEQAKLQAPHFQVYHYPTPREGINKLLADEGLKKVGFEALHTSYSQYQEWVGDNDQIQWEPLVGIVEELRLCKDEDEINKIKKAAQLTDAGFEHILGFLKPGVSEREIALELEFFLRREGADKMSFDPIIGSGPNGARPHARPGERTLEVGDLVVLDFGVLYQGYCSDMTRTVVIGEASQEQRERYELVLRAQKAGVAAVRPRPAKEVDGIVRQYFIDEGLGDHFGHGLGHAVGLEIHEDPRLTPQSEHMLEAGNVVTIEPGLYFPGWGGIRIEDLVLVTEDGYEVFSQSPKELLIL
ncbi:MAG: M24 family metallopeptidase [Limnochordia bacterium]|jgi:Xaa-Pro aminopeptidase